MQVSVIIVNYNVSAFLQLCLDSVTKALKPIKGEIIVVDNHSSDESCAMVKQYFPEVKLIENKTNVGFGKANNQGVAQAQGDYILILNPDTIIPENTFILLLNFAKSQTQLGAVGTALYDGTGTFLPESKRNIPTPKVAFNKLLAKDRSYYNSNLKENDTGEVEILVGAFMFLKRSNYEQVGGFDERYFMFGEDIDLSYTLLQNGLKNFYFPKFKVIHFKGESSVKDEKYLNNFYGAMDLFYDKYFKQNFIFEVISKSGIEVFKFLQKLEKKNSSTIQKDYKNVLYVGSESPVYDALVKFYNSAQTHIYAVCETRTISKYDDLERLKTLIKEKNIDHIVFDSQNNSFEKIIFYITQLKGITQNLTYDIRITDTNLIIGSHHKNEMGHVEQLEL